MAANAGQTLVESQYIKSNVGPPLAEALADVLRHQHYGRPVKDPVQ